MDKNGWFFVAEYDYTTPMVSIIRETEEEILTAFTQLNFITSSAKRITLYKMKNGFSTDVKVLWKRIIP